MTGVGNSGLYPLGTPFSGSNIERSASNCWFAVSDTSINSAELNGSFGTEERFATLPPYGKESSAVGPFCRRNRYQYRTMRDAPGSWIANVEQRKSDKE